MSQTTEPLPKPEPAQFQADEVRWSIKTGDALTVLKTMPDESIDMVMTSPPYWGLRDYGVDGQLGLEPDFRQYITNLCDIFDEVKRVLKPEGTCWVNLGDSYVGGKGASSGVYDQVRDGSRPTLQIPAHHTGGKGKTRPADNRNLGIAAKSLVQIPNRFAIEMTDRGWILRNEIIWHKPSTMPQSVKDRFTVDFEKLFFFTKSKKYHFTQQFEALADPYRTNYAPGAGKLGANRDRNDGDLSQRARNMTFPEGRNKRTVWRINPKPFAEAHFAVYPEELCQTPILAGSPVAGTVLDPFTGSGTTGLVALRLARHFIGIELNPEYVAMAKKRLAAQNRQRRLIA